MTKNLAAENAALFRGLKALSDSAFPKKCANCGRVFESVEELIEKSQGVGTGSGLKQSFDEDDQPILELFRNCVCGSTLMDFCSDRRLTSPKGLRRRLLFGRILETLVERGLEPGFARQELLKIMHGETSTVLQKLGISLAN